jgi:hypothetical protein
MGRALWHWQQSMGRAVALAAKHGFFGDTGASRFSMTLRTFHNRPMIARMTFSALQG